MKQLNVASATGQSDSYASDETADSLCSLCGISAPVAGRVGRAGSWSYAQCAGCGALSLDPVPDEEALRAYYNDAYMVPSERYARQIARQAPPILKELRERFPGRGKLLEVGCSWGLFLDAARREGWVAEGIELDDRAAKYGREQTGLKILTGTLESEIGRLEPPYDVIAAFHVIEHLRDPIGFLCQCRELLRNGGVLILKTPNVASWIASKTGEYWEWLCPPAHIHLFSPATMKLALQRSGFRVEEIRSRRGDAHNHLFQLLRALVTHIGSKNYVGPSRATGTPGSGRSGRLNNSHVNAAIKLSDAVYYPVGLVLDPWLEKRGLQPELMAIATAVPL
jgi:2-polyprenyl-3-methyl-5-hydroxy-6-metoxy-1,4-benzoquinol methylase